MIHGILCRFYSRYSIVKLGPKVCVNLSPPPTSWINPLDLLEVKYSLLHVVLMNMFSDASVNERDVCMHDTCTYMRKYIPYHIMNVV